MKQIVEQAARIAKGLLPKCKDCGGDGVIDKSGIGIEQCLSKDIGPCPTCARLREIASWKWMNEWPRWPYGCSTVESMMGKTIITPDNPKLDIPALRQLLEDLGEWEGFKDWIWNGGMLSSKGGIGGVFDILTDSTLLAEAVLEYLKEVK